MSTIPQDILAADAAGRIPDEISLSFLAETRDREAIVALYFLGALTLVVMALRCYARIWVSRRVGLDDALAIATMPFFITFVVLSVILIQLGSGRHIQYIQYVLDHETVNKTEVLDYVAHILYTTALLICRLSGLAFYHRLAARYGKLYMSIKIAVVFFVAAYLPQICLLIFHCIPVTGLWPYEWQSEYPDFKCLTWGLVYSVNSGVSLTCDIAMFIIPAILIKLLIVDWKRKLQLSAVMFPGVLVIGISTARVYLVIVGQWSMDGSWAYNPMMAIEASEIAGTLIALSVPALKPLLGTWADHFHAYRTGTSQSNLQTKPNNSNSHSAIKLSAMQKQKPESFSVMDEYAPETYVSVRKPRPNFRDDSSAEDLLPEGHPRPGLVVDIKTDWSHISDSASKIQR